MNMTPTIQPQRVHSVRLIIVLLITLTLLLAAIATLQPPDTAAEETEISSLYLPSVMVPGPLAVIPVGQSISQPVSITHAGDDRLFIGQRTGEIVILHPDGSETTFLDISDRVVTNASEYGFFDIAFHPLYAQTGQFYVSYTGQISETVYLNISRFRVTADPDVADPASEAVLVQMEQTAPVHKGGGLDFDRRDHHLYIGIGEDWKSPYAQDPARLNGKIVRVDVDRIPSDAVGSVTTIAPPEMVAMGLRNPWRIDLDEATDRLFIADVGSSAWEEINILPLSQIGMNFGWPCKEGPEEGRDIPSGFSCDPAAVLVDPAYAYAHDNGRCAVIGGGVYRPQTNPNDGRYLLADLCSREAFLLTEGPSGDWTASALGKLAAQQLVITAGTGPQGEKYLGTGIGQGPIYRLALP